MVYNERKVSANQEEVDQYLRVCKQHRQKDWPPVLCLCQNKMAKSKAEVGVSGILWSSKEVGAKMCGKIDL